MTAVGLLWAAPSYATDDVVGADVLAMGGAAAADPTNNAAVTVNPGLLALSRRYDLHGHLALRSTGGFQWGASAVDGHTSKFLWMGLAYQGDRYQPPLTVAEMPGWSIPGEEIANMKRTDAFTLAMALPFANDRLSFGVNGTLQLFNHDRQGRGATGNTDVGLGARPATWMVLGIAGENLLPIDDVVVQPLGARGGVRVYDDEIGALELNAGWREITGLHFSAGAEKNAGVARIRAGYGNDGSHRVSWGLGIVGNGAALNYGMVVPVGSGEPAASGLMHQVSLHFKAPDFKEKPPDW